MRSATIGACRRGVQERSFSNRIGDSDRLNGCDHARPRIAARAAPAARVSVRGPPAAAAAAAWRARPTCEAPPLSGGLESSWQRRAGASFSEPHFRPGAPPPLWRAGPRHALRAAPARPAPVVFAELGERGEYALPERSRALLRALQAFIADKGALPQEHDAWPYPETGVEHKPR